MVFCTRAGGFFIFTAAKKTGIAGACSLSLLSGILHSCWRILFMPRPKNIFWSRPVYIPPDNWDKWRGFSSFSGHTTSALPLPRYAPMVAENRLSILLVRCSIGRLFPYLPGAAFYDWCTGLVPALAFSLAQQFLEPTARKRLQVSLKRETHQLVSNWNNAFPGTEFTMPA